jgi:hypothetical protein
MTWPKDEIRLVLDQRDFDDLIHGHEITKYGRYQQPVRIILSDIGYALMADMIADARRRG